MFYLVLSYKYTEYRIMQYIEEITLGNQEILEQIEDTKLTLEYKNTRAYKNKILKAERGMKNNWEEVISLIEEEQYKKYTEESPNNQQEIIPQNLLDEQSLISTMSIYEKWIYFLFQKDIR